VLSDEKIIFLAKEEEMLHPHSSLIDYYKLFFQGTFGPGHFIQNEIQAKEFLQRELASATSFEDHYYQDVSFINQFYRLNLKAIPDQLVSLEDFFRAFLNSTEIDNIISKDEWMKFWRQIEKILKKSSVKIRDFDEASQILQKAFQEKKILFSHSTIYHHYYNPHYRLISKEEFIKLGVENKK
jgi:hypothetical protein